MKAQLSQTCRTEKAIHIMVLRYVFIPVVKIHSIWLTSSRRQLNHILKQQPAIKTRKASILLKLQVNREPATYYLTAVIEGIPLSLIIEFKNIWLQQRNMFISSCLGYLWTCVVTTLHRRRISSILIYIFSYFTFQQNPCYSNPCHGKFSVCQVGFTDRGFRCIGNVLSILPNTILLTCSLNFCSKIKLFWPLFITCDKYWRMKHFRN